MIHLTSNHSIAALVGLLLDEWIGDPTFYTHPVILISRMAYFFEQKLYSNERSAIIQRVHGGILTMLVLLIVYTLTTLIIWIATRISPWVGFALNAWLISTTIAAKGLAEAGRRVLQSLQCGNLTDARKYTGYIVSRETTHLDEPELVRATVETIAENIVDAVISPLFYSMIGGAPLALVYRAANTLDSLFGYKNDRYLNFGQMSARIDDVLNFIPARISLLLFATLAPFFHKTPSSIVRIVKRDAKKHPSPNSGIPESACAALLQVQLGGENRYHGRSHVRAYLGDPILPLSQQTIVGVTRILWVIVCYLLVICIIGVFM